MTDNGPRHVSVRTFRSDIKEILDGARFLDRCYIITNRDQAVAQVIPPSNNHKHDTDHISVTDLRKKTSKILKSVHQQNRSFLIVRHGRPEAIICPLQKQGHAA